MKGKKPSIGFKYAWSGIYFVIKEERNFRIHLFITSLVVFTGIMLKVSRFEWLALLLVIGLVLVAETVNSAIERLIDYVKPDIHPMAKKIKDLAAGAVLIAAIISVFVGLIVFIPYVCELWQ
ncbi:diacylglycerol kinase [Cerasibacillus quisquiliarum]|uniref:Diacylglycerol kinase n=1 Tax=Cerasibacillus quisquiliarum TaxID=227865 RepID=A0A511UWV0_9BACI|nr:diacylglycerol kinase family protein [Cerasibacillus quisquiliarum]MBB5145535.1 diacylglycerol kinase [Cerasibacillus quisquiliarum]GEN31069.1 diacylglycerol kinase [Cerasibacillus quisquiliarum]